MFNKNQSLVLGGFFLLNLLISVSAPALINNVGPAGSTGATGLPGSQGPAGEAGTDGREVEFRVEGNVLQWRYVGESTWRSLDLDFGNGGGSIISGEGNSIFTHWLFSEEAISIPFPTLEAEPTITNQTSYVASKVAQGFTAINNLDEFVGIVNNLNGKYVLAADLDLTVRNSADVEVSPYAIIPAPYDDNYNKQPFTGTLDGAGFTISNFTIDTSVDYNGINQYYGLFEYVEGATFKNLNLRDFDFNVTQSTYNVGALSSSIGDTFAPTIIDNVSLDGFDFYMTNGSLSYMGGFVGNVQSDSSVKIYRSEVKNFNISLESQGNENAYYLGSFVGNNSGNLVIGESTGEMTIISKVNDSNYTPTYDVGGAVGNANYGSVLQMDDSDFTLSGQFGHRVGGAVGTASSDTKISITNTTTNVDIDAIHNYDGGDNYGGLIGAIDDEAIVLINGVETSGTITGDESLGGFIGKYDMEGLLRIENSTTFIDFYGNSEIGGIIGGTDDYPSAKVLIDNVRVAGSFSNYVGENEAISSNMDDVGGFIGFIETSDYENPAYWNQIWIRNSIVDDVTITLQPQIEFGQEDELDVASINNSEFDSIGGAVGYSYEHNFIRLSNNVLETTINLHVENLGFDGDYHDSDDIGGLFGYLEYNQDIQLINNISTLTINFTFANNTSLAEYNDTVRFYLSSIGGAFGYAEEGKIIDIAGDYTLNINVDLNDNDFVLIDFEFSLYQIGGYAGQLDNDVIFLGESISTSLNIDLSLNLLDNPAYDRISVELYEIGEFIGLLTGFVILGDVQYTSDLSFTLPEGEGISLYVFDYENIGFSGNPFSFYIIR